jgi:hypothetical protein
MWWRSGAGALTLITLIAGFAIVTGVIAIAVAVQQRHRRDTTANVFSCSPRVSTQTKRLQGDTTLPSSDGPTASPAAADAMTRLS